MGKVYIGRSNIHGKGIFAKKKIKKGEIIFNVEGKKKKLFINNPKNSMIGRRWLGIGKNIWLIPNKDNALNFLNHSCNPNAGIKRKATFIAIKNIKRDEEITFDYSISEGDIYWKMKCNCGEKECRKKIYSIQFLSSKVFKKYLPYIPKYFQKVFFNEHKIKAKRI